MPRLQHETRRRIDAQGFLAELWGETPPGWIQLWEIATKASRYVAQPSTIGSDLDGLADIYTGVGLAPSPLGARVRAKADEVVAIAGLWLDIDIDGPGRKADGVPDRDAALELAHAVLPPTLLVDSGYGVHAWHLFDDGPWRFDSDQDRKHAATMAWQWHALHRRYCEVWGWHLGGTHDLARLLRLPGTVNAKRRPAVPVSVGTDRGPRHHRRALSRLCAEAGQPTAPDRGSGLGDLDLDIPDMPEWVEHLLRTAHGVRMAYAHEPERAGWSTSEWDLALATRACDPRLGLTDAQIATLIVCHRNSRPDADPRKTRRLKYIGDTVAKARTRST